MSNKGYRIITLFCVFILAPSIAGGLKYSIVTGVCLFSALCLIFQITLTLAEIKSILERREAWFMKKMHPEEKNQYWNARFRG